MYIVESLKIERRELNADIRRYEKEIAELKASNEDKK